MITCKRCHWFYHPTSGLRNAKTCKALGEKATNHPCEYFLDKDTTVHAPENPCRNLSIEEVKAGIGALDKPDYKKIFKEIISEQFVLLQDGFVSVNAIKSILQQQGSDVEYVETDFIKFVEKLSRLFMLHRLILISGMAPYLDKIMDHEINNLFSRRDTASGKVVTTQD